MLFFPVLAWLAITTPSLSIPTGRMPVLAIAATCGVQEEEADSQQEIAEQVQLLVKGDPEQRANAVETIAAIGGPESVTLVLQTLHDPDPYVADAAQLVLPDLESPDLIDRLLGSDGLKSRDPLVRERVAEAIGRLDRPVDAQALLRFVKVRDVQLSRTLLWSLERLAEHGQLSGKPQRTIKSVRLLTGRGDNDHVRAAAMQVLSQLDPYDGSIALDNLQATSGFETACCLMDIFQRLMPTGYIGAIIRGMQHPNPGVRMRAVDVLMRSGVTRATLGEIIERLGVEPRSGVRRRLVAALRYFTGEALGDEVGPWKELLSGLDPSWTTAEVQTSIRESPRVSGDISVLRNFAPASDRVAILLDVSASFWSPLESGSSRADRVLPEVSALLRRLNQKGEFLLLPFGDVPVPWSREPVRATPEQTVAAARYVTEELARQTSKNQGSNIHAAISKALEFEELDRLVIITGASTYVGAHGDSSLMIRLFEEKSRFRPAIFDFVLLGEVGSNASRWTQLAASRGGRIYRVNPR